MNSRSHVDDSMFAIVTVLVETGLVSKAEIMVVTTGRQNLLLLLVCLWCYELGRTHSPGCEWGVLA